MTTYQNENLGINIFPQNARGVPHSDEIEMAVIGAMLLSNKNISKAIELLSPDAFYNPRHKIIYEAILKLFEKNKSIDLLILSDYLSNHNQLDNAGGSFYIAQIATAVSNSANFEEYARLLLEKHIKRSLIEVSESIIETSMDNTTDALEDIDKAEAKIFEIAERRMKKSFSTMKTLANDAYSIIQIMRKNDIDSVQVITGFNELDHLLGGMHKSDLLILAARPSMGKTALALSIAKNTAMKQKNAVAFFSLEMTANQLVTRLISAEAEVDQHKIIKGVISNDEDSKIVDSLGVLSELPIYIDDSPSLTMIELRAKARRLKIEKDIKIIIIDYLQLMNAPKSETREREISFISRSLKQLAKELDIPVLALAQLNRSVEARTDKRPMLSDLRESGSIEQDADVVMFVHRPELYGINYFDKDKKYPTENMAEIIIGKQRNGPTGAIKLGFLKNYAKFVNPAFGMEPDEYVNDEGNESTFTEDNFYYDDENEDAGF